MKVTRIVNRGRIAPSSPKPIIDSGRTSFSSASAVSTIETNSPEPQITEQQVAQKLQQSVATSPVSKKIAYVIGAVVIVLCLIAIITGTVVALKGSSSSTTTIPPTATTEGTTRISTKSLKI